MARSPYRAIRNDVALVDRSDRGRLRLTGPDAASYLHGLLTNDITGLAVGTGCYAAYLTPQGRMITDLRVFRTDEGLFLVVSGGVRHVVRGRLEQLIFNEDVQVVDLTDTWTAWGLYGPSAPRVLARVGEGSTEGVTARAPAGLAAFQHWRGQIGASPVVIAVSDEIGVPGFDVFAERAHGDVVEAALVEAGALKVAPDVANIVRIESGVPEFGVDMSADTIPLEAGIERRAISDTKGCYVGQEVIVRVRDRGHGRVARRLVGLLVEGAEAPGAGDALFVGDRDIGRVTSAVKSPLLGRPIAMGYVHRDFTDPGTRVSISSGSPRVEAVVTALPFV